MFQGSDSSCCRITHVSHWSFSDTKIIRKSLWKTEGVTHVFNSFMFCKSFSGLSNQSCQIHPEGTNLYIKLCLLHRGKNKVTAAHKTGVNNKETDMVAQSNHERKGDHPSFTDLVSLNSVFLQPSFRVCVKRFVIHSTEIPFQVGGAWCGPWKKSGVVGRGC